MRSIKEKTVRLWRRRIARTGALAVLALGLATLAMAVTPGWEGCCYYQGSMYCPAALGGTGCTNDATCTTYACGFLWLSTCYDISGLQCPPPLMN